MESLQEDYYKLLGASKHSTQEELKKNYRALSLIHHPDKGGSEEFMKKLNLAYEVLSDVKKRSEFDVSRDDTDDDNDFFAGVGNVMTLSNGFKFSDLFRDIYEKAKSQKHISLNDNISQVIYPILKECLENQLFNLPQFEPPFKCSICKNEYDSENAHDSAHLMSLQHIIDNESIEFDSFIDTKLSRETTEWKKINFVSTKTQAIFLEKQWAQISLTTKKIELCTNKNNPIENFRFTHEEQLLVNEIVQTKPLFKIQSHFTDKQLTSIEKMFNKELQFEKLDPSRCVKWGLDQTKKVACGVLLEISNPNLEAYISKRHFPKFQVVDPKSIFNISAVSCALCKKEFGIFRWKYNCKICSEMICSACYTKRQVPKYGFISPVEVCRSCGELESMIEIQIWIDSAREIIGEDPGNLKGFEFCIIAAKIFNKSELNLSSFHKIEQELLLKGASQAVSFIYYHLKLTWAELEERIVKNIAIGKYSLAKTLVSSYFEFTNQLGDRKYFLNLASKVRNIETPSKVKGILWILYLIEGNCGFTESLDSLLLLREHNQRVAVQLGLCFLTRRSTTGDISKLIHSKLALDNLDVLIPLMEDANKTQWLEILNVLMRFDQTHNFFFLREFIQTCGKLTDSDHPLIGNVSKDNLISVIQSILIEIERGNTFQAVFTCGLLLHQWIEVDINHFYESKRLLEGLFYLKLEENAKQTKIDWKLISEDFLEKDLAFAFQLLESSPQSWQETAEQFFCEKRWKTSLQCLMQIDPFPEALIFEKCEMLKGEEKRKHLGLYLYQIFKFGKHMKSLTFSKIAQMFEQDSDFSNFMVSFIKKHSQETLLLADGYQILAEYHMKNKKIDLAYATIHHSCRLEALNKKKELFTTIRNAYKSKSSQLFKSETLQIIVYASPSELLIKLRSLNLWQAESVHEFVDEMQKKVNNIQRAQFNLILLKSLGFIKQKKMKEASKQINFLLSQAIDEETFSAIVTIVSALKFRTVSLDTYFTDLKALLSGNKTLAEVFPSPEYPVVNNY